MITYCDLMGKHKIQTTVGPSQPCLRYASGDDEAQCGEESELDSEGWLGKPGAVPWAHHGEKQAEHG
jgi:hypothetical protein